MVDIKKLEPGSPVVIMNDNKPFETRIRAINIFKRFTNNQKSEKTELFVEGIEREVKPEELFASVQDYANSLVPSGEKIKQ